MSKKDGGSMTVKEAGRLGGAKRKAVLNHADWVAMGKNGGNVTKERHGPEFYSRIGHEGGVALFTARGPEYYSEIGRKGAARVRQLVAQGRAAEADDKLHEAAGNPSDNELGLI